eukprot:m.168857 g.168857  ORF g.168857 m.168857 type:complete len:75 (+) comp17796_c2_seq1:60-284(+)
MRGAGDTACDSHRSFVSQFINDKNNHNNNTNTPKHKLRLTPTQDLLCLPCHFKPQCDPSGFIGGYTLQVLLLDS